MRPSIVSSGIRKLRVLCFHGFRTNGLIMETQLKKLDQSVLDLMEMTCLDAPYPALGKSDVEGIFPPPYYEWFQFKETENGPVFTNLKECIEIITEHMEKHGPYDGLVGFSQGAFLCGALAGMQQQGLALTSVPKLRFVIIISGGVLNGEHEWKSCYSDPIKCASVHLIGICYALEEFMVYEVCTTIYNGFSLWQCCKAGSRDFLKARNEDLLQKYENPVVIRHDARHTVPRLGVEAVLPMKKFLENVLVSIKEEEDYGYFANITEDHNDHKEHIADRSSEWAYDYETTVLA
ncbi:hypothetical protein KP509_16G073800 [Ceratopteris richardii]|uniref:Serine hydrolase domain-containing protein n=1 Tax=Ceratopteris richardii TaxID=49495 RepID=A0A8T2T386_CERRI|nr:hypothetical protein KP509_16G073800 [Ceratopteris richardii]